jgi:hypothetical protein
MQVPITSWSNSDRESNQAHNSMPLYLERCIDATHEPERRPVAVLDPFAGQGTPPEGDDLVTRQQAGLTVAKTVAVSQCLEDAAVSRSHQVASLQAKGVVVSWR